MDAFFGSGASMWTAPTLGAVGVGYQLPMMAAPPSIGSASFGGPQMPSAEMTPGFPRTGSPPIAVPVPATPTMGMTTLATAMGVTPGSLLAAVGMRRGQPQGPANDQEVEEFLYDA